MARSVCPICRRLVKKSDPAFPFCSDRCRLLDLENWVSGKYRVTAPLPDSEEAVSESSPGEAPDDQPTSQRHK